MSITRALEVLAAWLERLLGAPSPQPVPVPVRVEQPRRRRS